MGLFDTKIPIYEAFATVAFDFKESTKEGTTETDSAGEVYILPAFEVEGSKFSVTSIEYSEVINQLPTCVFTCFNNTSTQVPTTISFETLKKEHKKNLEGMYERDKFSEALIDLQLLEFNNGGPITEYYSLQGFVSTPTTQLTPNGIQQTYTLVHKDLLFGEFDTRIYEYNDRHEFATFWNTFTGKINNFDGTNLFGEGGILHTFVKGMVDMNFELITAQGDALLNAAGDSSVKDHIILQGHKNKTYFTDYIEPFLTDPKNKERTNILKDYLNDDPTAIKHIEQIGFKTDIMSLFQQSGNFFDFLINICNYFNLEYIPSFILAEGEDTAKPSRVQTCRPILGTENILDEKLTYFTYDMDFNKNLIPISSVVLEGNLTPTTFPSPQMTDYNSINFKKAHIVGRFPLINTIEKMKPKYGRVLRLKAPAWISTVDDKSEVIRAEILLSPSGKGNTTRDPTAIKTKRLDEGDERVKEVLKNEVTALDTFAKSLYEIFGMRDFHATVGTPLCLDYPLGNIYDVRAKGETGEPLSLFKGYAVRRSFNFRSQNNNISISMSTEFTHVRVDDWMPYQLQ